MSKLKVIVHPVKKEFRRERCGFDHTPADDFVKSQWQSCANSVAYLIYRWLIALFFTAVVIESMIDPDDMTSFWLYFIYMTNWGIMMCMSTNLLGAILVTIWHCRPQYADKLLNMETLTSPFRIYWGMHIVTLVLSIVITIIYWSLLYNPEQDGLSATNVLTHAFNSICMFIDLLIVAHPLRLLHVFLPVSVGIVYAIFSLVYQLCGGVNKKGKPYIYHVIDWAEPKSATITVVGVLVLTCLVYMLLFMIYKLRSLLHRRMSSNSFFLGEGSDKTSTSTSTLAKSSSDGSGIQHSPSGISMVLGNYSCYHNQAFSTSDEKVAKY